MASSGELLRMLEPAVRPVATPGAGVPHSGPATFESQGFDQLLQAAQDVDDTNTTAFEIKPSESTPPDPLASLSRIDAVSNASLRRLLQTDI